MVNLTHNTFVFQSLSNETPDENSIIELMDSFGINFRLNGKSDRAVFIVCGDSLINQNDIIADISVNAKRDLNCEFYYYWDRFYDELYGNEDIFVDVINVAAFKAHEEIYKDLANNIRYRGYNSKEVLFALIDKIISTGDISNFFVPILYLDDEIFTNRLFGPNGLKRDITNVFETLIDVGLHRSLYGLVYENGIFLTMLGDNKRINAAIIKYILLYSNEAASNEHIAKCIGIFVERGDAVNMYTRMYGNDKINEFIGIVLTSNMLKENILEFCQVIGWYGNSEHVKYLISLGVDYEFIKPTKKTAIKYGLIGLGRNLMNRIKR